MTLEILDKAMTHYSGSFIEADERPTVLEAYSEVRESIMAAPLGSVNPVYAEQTNVALVPVELLYELVRPVIYPLVCVAVVQHINDRGMTALDFCDNDQEQRLAALVALLCVVDEQHSGYAFGALGYSTLQWLITCCIEAWCEDYRIAYDTSHSQANDD